MNPLPIPVAVGTPTAEKPLSVRVLHSFAEAESFRTAWNGLVVRSGADVYQTFEWCSTWWKHYGDKRSLHILLYFSGDELVGLVPAFIETLWLGPVWVRAGKLVGSDFSLHLCNLPVMSNHLPAVVAQALQHFIGQHRCDLLAIGPLAGPATPVDAIIAAGQHEPNLIESAKLLGTDCNTYFSLPATFDDYLKSLSKQQRDGLTRYLKQFSKAYQVKFDVVAQPEKLAAEFERFRELHAAQWKTEGKLGHFDDWPKAEAFNRDLIRTLGDQGMVRFYRIHANDQVVSSYFSYVFNGTNYARLPARVCGPEWDKYSFGRMGLVKMFETSLGEGQQIVEAGRGHYGYKLLLGGQEHPMRTIQFIRRGFGVSARVRLFRATADLLVKTYYKVFIRRIAPRMPALQGPIWPFMIRITWGT